VLLLNKNANKSLAEKKRIWEGENGRFAKKELNKWFKLYN
jgi:hypothetical protein